MEKNELSRQIGHQPISNHSYHALVSVDVVHTQMLNQFIDFCLLLIYT